GAGSQPTGPNVAQRGSGADALATQAHESGGCPPACSLGNAVQNARRRRGTGAMCFGKAETLVNYSFGTCQHRKIFPHFHPPNLLGNKFLPIRGVPHRGPGCYIAEESKDLANNLAKIPTSIKGYGFGARTAVRFKPKNKDVTPYPGMYQTVNLQEQTHKPNFAPFNTLSPRFRTHSKDPCYPGYVPLLLVHFNKEQ
ncbi:PIFO, partial [Cervus elaphus hippelaphus]